MLWFTTFFNIAINILSKTQIETSESRLERDCLPFIRARKPLINFTKNIVEEFRDFSCILQ